MNLFTIISLISSITLFMQVNCINIQVMRNNMLRVYIFNYLESVKYKPLSIIRLLELTKNNINIKLIQWHALYNQISEDDKYILEQLINILI
jgi:hypothetical protein